VSELDGDGNMPRCNVNTPESIHLKTCVTVGAIRYSGGKGSLSFAIRPDEERSRKSATFGRLKGKGQKL
jgi:hypothetical protein